MNATETASIDKITPSVGIVVWRDDQVLLIKRANPPFQGHWSIPGGKLEPGETLHDGALRELMEETGIHAEIIGLIDVFESISETNHYVMIDYAAIWHSGEPVAGDDAAEARFIACEEALDKLSWDMTRTALKQSREIIKRHKSALKGQ